ncbi:MAG: hypothetical protein IKU25_05125 [Clostridia bacterium]|nr:hypothetical protein [Clostridia bacterium]
MKIGKKVWHSQRLNSANAEVAEYGKPTEYVTHTNYLTVMPATSRGFLEIMRYGEDLENTWTVIANGKAFDGVFHEGDVMWVDGESPDETIDDEYGDGASANAVVKSVAEVNYTISVTLTRNKDQIKQ